MWVIVLNFALPAGSVQHLSINKVFKSKEACEAYMEKNHFGPKYSAEELEWI